MTDFQRLRRNVLREIHDYSAPHRMLFSYAKMEQSAPEMGFTSGGYIMQSGPGPIQEIRDCSFSFESLRSFLRKLLFRSGSFSSELTDSTELKEGGCPQTPN